MNIADDAQDHEAREWALRNAPREVRQFKPGDPGYGPEECDKCGDDVHPVRRANGWRLCTPCQSAREIVTGRLAR